MVKVAADDNATSDPRADGHVDHVGRTLSGAERVFCKGSQIRIVVEHGRCVKKLGEKGPERDGTPAREVRKVDHEAAARIQGTADRYPDRCNHSLLLGCSMAGQ